MILFDIFCPVLHTHCNTLTLAIAISIAIAIAIAIANANAIVIAIDYHRLYLTVFLYLFSPYCVSMDVFVFVNNL